MKLSQEELKEARIMFTSADLRRLAEVQGISLSELSRRTGYSEISLKKALSGDTDFSERMLTSVASALGCNVMLTLGGR